MPTPFQPNPNLKEFLSSQSEEAFRHLVADFGGLVFSSALRRTGERELAEEITQTVFAILARKAATAARHPSLTGWLFTVTKFEAAKAMRTRHRHQRKIAAITHEIPQSQSPEPRQDTLPHLDDLLDSLPKQERELLLARYIEEKPYQTLAQESGKTEAACKMQIRRILEKLRASLTSRGATVSLTTLSLTLATEFSRALPSSLAANLPTQALTAAASLKSGSLASTQIIHFMNTVKTTTIAFAVVAVCAIPIGLQHASAVNLRKELATLHEQVPAATNSTRIASPRPNSNSPRERLAPIARFLATSNIPDTGEQFLESVQSAIMDQNKSNMFKIMIPLSEADPAKIDTLIAEVEACDKYNMAKGTGLQMLLELSGEAKENPGDAIERGIDSGLSSYGLKDDMRTWLDKDPEAALAWFREKITNGGLVGEGLHDSPEASIAAAVAETLIKTDRQAALALIAEVDPLNRAKVINTLVPELLRDGKKSWPEVQNLISSMTNIDDRLEALGSVSSPRLFKRSEVRPFLNGMELSTVETSQALANVASVNIFESHEPVAERMAWLLEAAAPPELHEAVQRTIQPLAKREPAEVTAWVASLEQGEVRDAALAGQSASLMGKRKYNEAFTRTKLITDPAIRDAVTKRLRDQKAHESPTTPAE